MNRNIKNGNGQGLRRRDGTCLNQNRRKGEGRGACRRSQAGMTEAALAEATLAGAHQRNRERT